MNYGSPTSSLPPESTEPVAAPNGAAITPEEATTHRSDLGMSPASDGIIGNSEVAPERSAPSEPGTTTDADPPPEWPVPWTFPWVTTLVTVACVLIWAALSHETLPESNAALMKWGWLDAGAIWDGHWWSLVAACFVHGDLEHLAGNLAILWIFAWRLEQLTGHARWLLFLLLSCFVSAAVDQAWSGSHSYGASGLTSAVFGMFVAAWFRVRFLPAWIFFPVVLWNAWFGIVKDLYDLGSEFIEGVALGDVAYPAHLAGYAFGALVGALSFNRWPKWIPATAVALVVVACAIPLCWAPSSYEWLLHRAQRAHDFGDSIAATKWLDAAERRRPDLPGAPVMRAEFLLIDSRLDEALASAQRAVELEDAIVQKAEARARRELDEAEDAGDGASDAEESGEPSDASSSMTGYVRSVRGTILLHHSRHAEAEVDFNTALQRSPDDAFAFAMRGLVRLEVSRHEEALDDLNQALLLNPNDPITRIVRGMTYQERGEPLAAQSDFLEAIDLLLAAGELPVDADGLHALGAVRAEQHDWDTAAEALTMALEQSPRRADSASLLAYIRCRQKEFSEALLWADRSVEWNKRSAYSWYVRGLALDGLDRQDQALAAFSHSIELNPRSTATLVGRAIALRRQGKLDESMADLNRAINLNDRFATAYATRAKTWTALKQPDKAHADRQTALTLDPSLEIDRDDTDAKE